MHAGRQLMMAPMLLGIALIGGCSNEPKDPFKDWGAAQKYSNFVPETAQSVAKGVGILTFTAPSNGVLYLIDTSVMVPVKDVQKPKLIIQGGVPAGTEVTFNPDEKRVYAKGREGVRLRGIDPTHTHEFRFEPESRQ